MAETFSARWKRNEKIMNVLWVLAAAVNWMVLGACWLGWHLLRQNGRILLRMQDLEKRLDKLGIGESSSSRHEDIPDEKSEGREQRRDTSAVTNRFSNHSLTRSRINRAGLAAGTPAPNFSLPRPDGSNLSLVDFQGQRVLLVFSDPHCGPCNALAPELEKLHREDRGIQLVMVSRGEPNENRAKVKEHGLTFPLVLQRRWEISRLYAMFATPMAYMIDAQGVILNDVAVGVEPILALLAEARKTQPEATAASTLDSSAEVCSILKLKA